MRTKVVKRMPNSDPVPCRRRVPLPTDAAKRAGEDKRVASSVRQNSEMFLSDLGDGTTEIRVKAKAQVFGKLGSFGLNVMKTKIERLWQEFCGNVGEQLA